MMLCWLKEWRDIKATGSKNNNNKPVKGCLKGRDGLGFRFLREAMMNCHVKVIIVKLPSINRQLKRDGNEEDALG